MKMLERMLTISLALRFMTKEEKETINYSEKQKSNWFHER